MDEIQEGEIEDAHPMPERKAGQSKDNNDFKEQSNSPSPILEIEHEKVAPPKKKQDSKPKKPKKSKTTKPAEIISSSYRTKKCEFYMKGACSKGDNCEFSHNFPVEKSRKLCKFFMNGLCSKGAACFFNHDTTTYPCRFFHLERHCKAGPDCRFSHDPIREEDLDEFLTENLDLLTNMYNSKRLEHEPMLKQFVERKQPSVVEANQQMPTMLPFAQQPYQPSLAGFSLPNSIPPNAPQYHQSFNPMWGRQHGTSPMQPMGGQFYGSNVQSFRGPYPFPNNQPPNYHHQGQGMPHMYMPMQMPFYQQTGGSMMRSSNASGTPSKETAPLMFLPPTGTPSNSVPYSPSENMWPTAAQPPRTHQAMPIPEKTRESFEQNRDRNSRNKLPQKIEASPSKKKTVNPTHTPTSAHVTPEPTLTSLEVLRKQSSPRKPHKSSVDGELVRCLRVFLDHRY